MNTDLDPLGSNYYREIKSENKKKLPSDLVEIIQKTEVSLSEKSSFSVESVKFTVLKCIFPELTHKEHEIIGKRLDQFAIDSGIDPQAMYRKIQNGKNILEKIENSTILSKTPTSDLVDVDWYFRAQLAKMDKLYLNGALKFPDPEHKFLEFTLNTKGTFRGKKESVYTRLSSHWPELQKRISHSTFQLPNGDHVCFSKKSAKKLKNSSGKVHLFENTNFGLDASTKEGKSLGLAGDNNKTFLIAPLVEDNVPMIAIKNETYSAKKVTSFNHLVDSIFHTLQWLKKKGPVKLIRSDYTPSNYPVRKEDVLTDQLKAKLALIDLKNPIAKETYKALIKTEKLGSEYSLNTLKDHLEFLITVADDSQKPAIQDALNEINLIYADYDALSKDWKYHILPRSQECILPTIREMLDGKVPFINSNSNLES